MTHLAPTPTNALTILSTSLPRVLLFDWPKHYLDSWFAEVKKHADLVSLDLVRGCSADWHEDLKHILSNGMEGFGAERFDRIILGHNQGRGLELAKLMPQAMLPRVVVVSRDMPMDQEADPYIELGIHLFGTRAELFRFRFITDLVAKAA